MLDDKFGPWTTSLATDSRLALSAFWRRRLERLPAIMGNRCRLATGALLLLASIIGAFAGFPLLSTRQPLLSAATEGGGATKTAAAAATTDANSAVEERAVQQLVAPTNVDFLEFSLTDAVQFLSDYHALPIWWDNAELQGAGIAPQVGHVATMSLRGFKLETVLQLLLEPEGLGYFPLGGNLIITSRRKAAAQDSLRQYELGDVVRSGIALADLADAIARAVAPSTWRRANGAGSIRIVDQSLHVRHRAEVQALVQRLIDETRNAIDDPGAAGESDSTSTESIDLANWRKLGFTNEEILHWTSSSLVDMTRTADGRPRVELEADRLVLRDQDIHARAAIAFFRKGLEQFAGRPSERHAAALKAYYVARLFANRHTTSLIRRQLARSVSVTFVQTPLEEALTYLDCTTGFRIAMDRADLKRLGVAVDLPMTLTVSKQPLAEVLTSVLDPISLAWHVAEPGLIVVTGRATGKKHVEPRVYRVGGVPDFWRSGPKLVERITSTIEPDSWASAGGAGSVALLPGLLIVVNHNRVQTEIEHLLESLRNQSGK